MNLNKYFKYLIIIFPIILSSCNSYNISKYKKEKNIKSIEFNNINNKNFSKLNNILYYKYNNINLEKLKKNNIIYFECNEYSLNDKSIKLLKKHAKFLIKHPYIKIIIEGHTDERGTPESNINLGYKRANTVKIFLENNGVSSNQLEIISYGKEKPLFLGRNEHSYSKNRCTLILY